MTITALIIAATIFIISVYSPRFGLVLWLLSVCFIPFWMGIKLGTYLPPTSLIGICILGGVFYKSRWKFTAADAFVVSLCGFSLTLSLLGLSLPGHGANVLLQWLLAFAVGRVLVQKTGLIFAYRVISMLFVLVAIFALIEFTIGWNPYYALTGDQAQTDLLASAQIRGEIERSEWAFGHSIALANSLAMAIPVVFSAKFSRTCTACSAVILFLGTLVTFSRSGIISAVLAITLTYIFSADRQISRRMTSFLVLGSAAAVLAVPTVLEVFSSASEETQRSADHRFAILNLIPHLNLFGVADGYTESAGGQFYWRGVISIDNAFLRIGVNFGLFIAIAFVVGAFALVFRVLRRRGTTPMISIAAVIPALFTVSLITQFGSLFFFYVGIAALTWYNTKPTTTDSTIERPLASVQSGLGEK